MSGRNVQNTLMALKLKEGVQDTIVYLRMLEGAKLAPVYERKRKQLMDQLLDLQGDTRREAPPKFESSDDEDDDEVTPDSPVKSPKQQHTTAPPKLSDRMSKFENPSSTAAGAKKFRYKTLEELKKRNSITSEGGESKGDEKETEEEKAAAAKEDKTEPIAEEKDVKMDSLEVDKKDSAKASPRTTPSTTPTGTPDTKRKNRAATLAGGLFSKVKKRKHQEKERSGSDASATSGGGGTESTSANAAENKSVDNLELDEEEEEQGGGAKAVEEKKESKTEEKVEQEKPEPVEEIPEEGTDDAAGESNLPLVSQLERVTKRLGRYTYQKIEMTLLAECVKYRKPSQHVDKSTVVSLIGAASAIRDSFQFELHTPDKSYTFRADSEELCARWVSSLSEAIDICNPTPIEEEPPEEEELQPSPKKAHDTSEIPQITVSSSQEGSPEKQHTSPSMRSSVSYENFTPGSQKKSKKEMPDFSAAQVKGYMYKKGTLGRWDKVWMGLHHDNTLYITTNETNKKIQGTVALTAETKIERKRGSDKLPHALQLVTGRAKDTFATDSLQDYSMWVYCLEQATAGPNDIEELLSEDEDDGGELYEELGVDEPTPQLPTRPRPPPSPRLNPQPHIQPQPIEEDIYEDGGDYDDGEIYEGLDDVDMPPVKASPVQPPPISSIPPHRGSDPTVQPPSLPPRNPLPTGQPPPVLPPRLKKPEPNPQDYEAPKPSPPMVKKQPSEPAAIDEEVYDDVVGIQANEDLEETYDDVESVAPKKSLPKVVSSDELYEDMTQEQMSSMNQVIELDEDEEYSDMTLQPGGDIEPIDEDVYDDVDTSVPPPRPPPPKTTETTTSTSPSVSSKAPALSSATVKPPPTVSSMRQQKSMDDSAAKKLSPSSPDIKKSSTLPNRPSSAGTGKRMNTSGKVAQMSKMFGQPTDDSSPPESRQRAATLKKAAHSGSLMYKSPGKSSYSMNHCVLENSVLIFYRSATDKLSHYRLSLRDASLKLGTPDGQGAKFTFQVLKGTTTHHFCVSTREEFVSWMGVLVTSAQKVCPEKEDLYHASSDYNGKEKNEVSFKKDAVIWVIQRDSSTTWTGIIGTSESTFSNTVGQFPKTVISPLVSEDVYI